MAFDAGNPPAEPPPETDPTIWFIARRVVLDHAPDADRRCQLCKVPNPCNARSIAQYTLYLAVAGRWQVWKANEVHG
ncbi:hypothetical protein [Actinoplanes sp. DH11]|uniref:hypothetical protein n=1 Tax=Actinoplanes sp. DH11 TaxID=2857011 RepID=UPI001E2A7228|nr:hypothetical protein [Actinoplanes sp. DH11]